MVLILQLVTGGGTMPYETLPESIRWMHDFFPMGYAVTGMRRPSYGVNESSLWASCWFWPCGVWRACCWVTWHAT